LKIVVVNLEEKTDRKFATTDEQWLFPALPMNMPNTPKK